MWEAIHWPVGLPETDSVQCSACGSMTGESAHSRPGPHWGWTTESPEYHEPGMTLAIHRFPAIPSIHCGMGRIFGEIRGSPSTRGTNDQRLPRSRPRIDRPAPDPSPSPAAAAVGSELRRWEASGLCQLSRSLRSTIPLAGNFACLMIPTATSRTASGPGGTIGYEATASGLGPGSSGGR